MEKILNGFMLRLNGKVPDECMETIKEQLYIFFRDFEITEKSTDLMAQLDSKELQLYLIAKKVEGKSIRTIDAYKQSLVKFLHFVNKPVTEIVTGDIQCYIYSLEMVNKMKPVSRENERMRINGFFSWLVNNDYMAKNPCRNIKAIKYDKHTRHYLKPIQLEKIRSKCKSLRDKAMIEFMYATGCRVGELVKVKLSDVDFEKKEVNLIGKGDKPRVSYLNARAVVAIQEYLNDREGDSEYLFCNYRKPYDHMGIRRVEVITKELGKRVNVEVTPHRIRHTTATDAIDHGMPVEQVQMLLGHEDISTTMEYAEVKQKNVKHCHEKYIV